MFQSLRRRYPVFRYRSFHKEETADRLRLTFHFEIPPDIHFDPYVEIFRPVTGFVYPDPAETDNLVFHLGLIEAISYWKCVCAPRISVECGALTSDQAAWWRDLFLDGLGEFIYINGIDYRGEPLVDFTFPMERAGTFAKGPFTEFPGNLIPVGGGKDSAVTLEVLRPLRSRSWAFLLNPTRAMTDSVRIAEIPPERTLIIRREIEPGLLELNRRGYLNGHTPFSAYLGFLGVLCARLTGCGHIVLSNETSSNYGNTEYLGRTVNHQYSKSLDFEGKFDEYVRAHLEPGIRYFSLLRPLEELRIARLFASLPEYPDVFRSCNAGMKEDRWCGECAKCLFVYIMLHPFMPLSRLTRLFGGDLLDREDLLPLFKRLLGREGVKPFDCVGTQEEVGAALALSLQAVRDQGGKPPVLLDHFGRLLAEEGRSPDREANRARDLLRRFHTDHRVPEEYLRLLRRFMADR